VEEEEEKKERGGEVCKIELETWRTEVIRSGIIPNLPNQMHAKFIRLQAGPNQVHEQK
jgi:hypothetical protein